MTVRPADALLAAGAVVLLAIALLARGSRPLSPERASWRVTPGVLNPAVTQATIESTVCRPGWTRSVRPPTSYTDALKLRQMRVYHRPGSPSDYQEDHLISLELGGHPSDPRNLWPEPRPRADAVDVIENQLNAEVCSRRLTLAEARRRESDLKHTAG